MVDQTLKITKVVRWQKYRASTFDPCNPDPQCPICNKSMGHSITLLVEDEGGEEFEIHAACLSE